VLPPRTDIDIKIVLTDAERAMYDAAESKARAFFESVLARGDAYVGKSTFTLQSALLPLRHLCAGGTFGAPRLPDEGNAEAEGAASLTTERIPDHEECIICQDVMDRPVETPCRHWFCRECIAAYKASAVGNNGCPICRASFETSQLAEPAPAVTSLALVPVAAEGAEGAGRRPPNTVLSKLQALVQDLKRVREDDPNAKCLVFSQFTQSIDWLKIELAKQGFGYRTITGSMPMKQRARAIEAFQSDPPTTIFLLSVRSGAVGITLTAANIVYMMEPCLNPALEEQAVGRVHRMGQLRPVTVKRLWISNSVEERITKVVKVRCRQGAQAAVVEEPAAAVRGRGRQTGAGSTVAGALNSDKQKFKTKEWSYLFGCAPSLST